MKLSIVIPAHNEEQRLPVALRSYARHFDRLLGNDVEIIVVTNHCDDATADMARQIAGEHSQIRVIDEPARIGKGGAIILGAKAARGDWIGFVDADGATSANEFARLFEVAQRAGGVIASRWATGANVTAQQKWLRLLSSRLFNFAIRILLGLKYKDTQCGAKIFKAEAWQKILPNIGITRFAFDVDILFQLRREKFCIIEEPTEWHDVAGSKVNILGSSLEMFLAIIRMRLLYSPLKPLVRIYERTIAKPVEFLLKDPLFRHTILLSTAAMVGHVCNIAFQMIVGRRLPANEYALLATFLALFAIISRPLGTLATAMNHYTSILLKEKRESLIGKLMLKWTVLTLIPSSVLSAICIIFSSLIADFFHLNRIEPIIVAALALPVACVAPVFSGSLAGLQRFGVSALAGSSASILRVLLTTVFIYFVFPASGWALAGHVAGMYGSFLIIAVVLAPLVLMKADHTARVPSMRLFLISAFIIQIASGVLVTGDVVFVRRYLPNATDFAYAATMSRIAIFLSSAVVSAMFPKVASFGSHRREDRAIYLKAMLYTGFFALMALALCLTIPGPMLNLFFNIEADQQLISQTRWMAVVMTMVALLGVNKAFLLAQRRFGILSINIVCALAYIAAVHVRHTSVAAVIITAAIANGVALITTTMGIIRKTSNTCEIIVAE
jgi:glycosyltransferase involved in cell wall biosynthesis/O-antigen/teichoic acid export membrane protein